MLILYAIAGTTLRDKAVHLLYCRLLLYPGEWPTYEKQVQRIIKKELREGIDYTWDNKNRVMNEAQALRFVTQNASIRRYFLKVMADRPNEVEEHFHALDRKLFAGHHNMKQDAIQGEERSADIGTSSYTEEEILNGRIVDVYAKRVLLDMLTDTSADTLYAYFGIDRKAYTRAYLEYKGLKEIVDYYGISELRYKLARPSIYYPLDGDGEAVGGDENEDDIE